MTAHDIYIIGRHPDTVHGSVGNCEKNKIKHCARIRSGCFLFAVILRDLRRVADLSVSGRQMYTGSVSVAPAAYKRQLPRNERFQCKAQFTHTVNFRLRRRTTHGNKQNGIDKGVYPNSRHKACKRPEMLFAAILAPHNQPRREGNARDRLDTT